MIRLYDWECPRGHKQEAAIEVPNGSAPPRTAMLKCRWCRGLETPHTRLISMPARYMGDKPRSPQIYGGRFDTMGHAPTPRLPPIPDNLTAKDAGDLLMRREVTEVIAERKAIRRQNEAKRKRARAGVDFRSHRLPGDPKI